MAITRGDVLSETGAHRPDDGKKLDRYGRTLASVYCDGGARRRASKARRGPMVDRSRPGAAVGEAQGALICFPDNPKTPHSCRCNGTCRHAYAPPHYLPSFSLCCLLCAY